LNPLLIREYAKRGTRVISVVVADTSSAVEAKNTLNTLKTINNIAKNNTLYVPMIALSNDLASGRKEVDDAAFMSICHLVELLTADVFEVDRNDRLNWLNPTKVIQTQPGIKLMTFSSEKNKVNDKVVLGYGSSEMVDSLLVLQSQELTTAPTLMPTRLKKTGFYVDEGQPVLIGMISSDASSIDRIIDSVEQTQHAEKAQKHAKLDRLHSDDDDDLIL
jgi:hypothetical protein